MEVPPRTELLLMLAARSAFVRDVVRPALARGEVMVSDRFELSTFAYQGGGRGLPREEIRALNAFATEGLRPDVTLLLDLPVAQGIERQRDAGKARDRIEQEASDFQERVRATYLEVAAQDPTVVIVDASGPPEIVQAGVRDVLARRHPEPFGLSGG
jgi:dTMP kinase